MATNLVSLAMKFLTPDLILKIASNLGLDKALTQKAVEAAVPGLLAGLVNRVAKPDGARVVTEVLAKQDGGLLGRLASTIGGSGQTALVSAGTSALTSLLGSTSVGGLAGALAKYAGVGDGPAKSLLGLIGPVVLGSLAQEQKAAKLDAGGIASLLSGQKDNIAAAMPAEFAKLLGGTGLLDQIQSNLKSVAAVSPAPTTVAPRKVETPARPVAAQPAARPVASPVATTAAAAVPAAPWWRLPLIAAALLGAAWSVFAPVRPPVQPAVVTGGAQRIVVDNVDVGGKIGTVLDQLRATLGTVKDAASAQAALPRMSEATAQLDTIAPLAAKLPPELRRSLASTVAAGMTGLNPLFNAALAAPGVAAVARPAIEQLRAKLDTLAKS